MDEENSEEIVVQIEQEFRITSNWTSSALKGDHLWAPTNVSGDFCYVSAEVNCLKGSARLKCSSCSTVVHQSCLSYLIEKVKFPCKFTFQNLPSNQYRKEVSIEHHWARRYSEKNKCMHCRKGFQCKVPISNKDIIPVSCSWCKAAYHNKETCFDKDRIGVECRLGVHRSIIVPPNWIFKLPQSQQKDQAQENADEKDDKKTTFFVRAIPSDEVKPLIVFINPKSGGNQGVRLLQKFQWLLNPRQVFDLTQGGPKMGLMLYRKVHNLRVLACGGDGTVGWVLSVIDQIGISPPPAVGVLPLGTGNDLARALGWGGGYTDEPVSEILSSICNSQPVLLDRWKVDVVKNPDAQASGDGKDNLPLNVVNNYFSIGVDAHIALAFHEAREAHPERFNSRIKNKMFYGQLGGKDLLVRKWRALSDYITLECDGKDYTSKLRDLKVHAIVFLNIPSYGGGTRPWNRSSGIQKPSTEDSIIEVLGLTTYQLPLLQAGGHGTCITQCREAKIVTSKTIPMQVDGEACKVAPSILTLSILNQATMLASKRSGIQRMTQQSSKNFEINVSYLSMTNYDKTRSNIDFLMKSASLLEKFEIEWGADLGTLRDIINSFLVSTKDERLSNDWYFLDFCSGKKALKIDRGEETLHYVSDIGSDNIYIMECSNETRPLTPKNEPKINELKLPDEPGKFVKKNTPEKKNSRMLDHTRDDISMQHNRKSPVLGPNLNNQTITNMNTSKKRESLSYKLFVLKDASYEKYRDKHGTKLYDSLMNAAKTRDLKMISEFRKEGSILAARNSLGCSLLHHASRSGHDQLVNYLIRYVFSNYQNAEILMNNNN